MRSAYHGSIKSQKIWQSLGLSKSGFVTAVVSSLWVDAQGVGEGVVADEKMEESAFGRNVGPWRTIQPLTLRYPYAGGEVL